MSPAYGRDTAQIGFYQAESPDLATYFRRAEEIARAHRGRPHWGKETTMDAAAILPNYPMAERFLAARAELDPRRTMENAYLRRVLGP
jgi:FAD/FMN-containing dehydrogenase